MNKEELESIQNLENLLVRHNFYTFGEDIRTLLNLVKIQDKAIDLIFEDLEVENKGTNTEELKSAYLLRAKSNGIFIKGDINE